MSDIELLDLESGFNVSRINYNFEVIEEAINNGVLNLSEGNNTMSQALDMDGHRILNVAQPLFTNDVLTKGYLDNIILEGVVPIYPTTLPYVIIDLSDGLDRELTEEEITSPFKILLNGVAGQKLIWPTALDAIAPSSNSIVLIDTDRSFSFYGETNAIDFTPDHASTLISLAFAPGVAFFQVNSIKSIPFIIPSFPYEIEDSDNGSLLVVDSPTDVDLTIDPFISSGFNVWVLQLGDGKATFPVDVLNKYGHTQTWGPGAVVKLSEIGDGAVVLLGDTSGDAVDSTPAAGVITIPQEKEGYVTISLDQNSTITFTGNAPVCTVLARITQVGGFAITWPASFKWVGGTVPVVSTTPAAVDLLALTTFDGGVTWLADLSKGFA